jgi:hypothetical protein
MTMGGGLLRVRPLRLPGLLFSCVPVARQPFARDLVDNDGCTLGKRELDPTSVGPVRGFRAFESAPPRSLTGPAALAPLTAVRSPDKAVSQPLLLIMQSWRPRTRPSVRPRGRGAAGGPSAGAAEPGLRNPWHPQCLVLSRPGVARRSCTAHGSAIFRQGMVPASAARSCGAGSSGLGRGTA